MEKFKKFNNYTLESLSKKAIEKLPEALDELGYKDRYEIINGYLRINSIMSKVEKAFLLAEEKAHGEPGYLMRLRKESFAELWVSKEEAATIKDAYKVAFASVENGYPVDNDPIFSVASADRAFAEAWEMDFMPDED